jgi:TPR repeat protein
MLVEDAIDKEIKLDLADTARAVVLREYHLRAEKGEAEAQRVLGLSYFHGDRADQPIRTPRDPKRGLALLEQAAAQQDVIALRELGLILGDHGRLRLGDYPNVVTFDEVRSQALLKAAAAAGDEKAGKYAK